MKVKVKTLKMTNYIALVSTYQLLDTQGIFFSFLNVTV
jgi:hypothetical protein